MGKCPKCGNSKLFLKTKKCAVCGKEGCDKCMHYLLTIGAEHVWLTDWWACSDKCYAEFENKLKQAVPPNEIKITMFQSTESAAPYYALFEGAVLSLGDPKDKNFRECIEKRESFATQTEDRVNKWKSDLSKNFKKHVDLMQAANLERAGRRREAARIYEFHGDLDKARILRDRASEIRVKSMGVSVDLNKLLQQVRDGGIVAVYRCPHCGGKLKVGKETKAESLRICEHCRSEIEAMDLADFLRDALS